MVTVFPQQVYNDAYNGIELVQITIIEGLSLCSDYILVEMTQRISFLESSLSTPEAKEAIGEGIVTLLQTRNFDAGWNAMMAAGRRNGSLAVVQTAIVFEVLKWIADMLSEK